MAHRINIILDDLAWSDLQDIPRGQRSKLVSEAIKRLAAAERREKAAQKMDVIRKRLPVVSTQKLVQSVRKDRERQ